MLHAGIAFKHALGSFECHMFIFEIMKRNANAKIKGLFFWQKPAVTQWMTPKRLFNFFILTTVLSHWDFSHGKFELLSPWKSQLWQSRATQPTVHAGCFSVSIFHRTLTWTTGSWTCAQMLMHTTAHGGVQTPQESLHWKLTLGEKSLAAPVNRTSLSGVTVRRSTNWATPQFYSLSI